MRQKSVLNSVALYLDAAGLEKTDRGMDLLHDVYEKTLRWVFSGRRYRMLVPPLPAFGRPFGPDGQRLKSAKIVTGGSALIAHVIAVDGQLVGGWKRSPARDSLRIHVNLLDRLAPAEEKRVQVEVRRFEAFTARAVETHGLGKRVARRR